MVAQKIKDPSICNRIDKNHKKDGCFSGIAVSTGNGTLCASVHELSEKDDCYIDVSANTGDVKLCEKISSTDPNARSHCIGTVAASAKDTNLCSQLETKTAQDDCIQGVATTNRDFNICKKIADTNKRVICQAQIAVSSRSTEDCKKIERESTKEDYIDQLTDKSSNSAKSCTTEFECDIDQVCVKKYCVTPECTEDTSYCSGEKREFCSEGTMHVETCIFGCENSDCLTKEEKEQNDKEKEETRTCEEGYKECTSEQGVEYCVDGKKTKGICEFGCKRGKCKSDPGVDISKQIANMKDKQQFAEIVSGPYMSALTYAIDNEKDNSKKAGLEA